MMMVMMMRSAFVIVALGFLLDLLEVLTRIIALKQLRMLVQLLLYLFVIVVVILMLILFELLQFGKLQGAPASGS